LRKLIITIKLYNKSVNPLIIKVKSFKKAFWSSP
jgi:hypothetical protein